MHKTLSILLLCLTAYVSTYTSSNAQTLNRSKMAAVLIHETGCKVCETLDARFHSAVKGVEGAPIQYVILDFSDRNIFNFYWQAQERNIDVALRGWFGNQPKPGNILLIDLDHSRVVGVLTREYSKAEMRGALMSTNAAS